MPGILKERPTKRAQSWPVYKRLVATEPGGLLEGGREFKDWGRAIAEKAFLRVSASWISTAGGTTGSASPADHT